jgi:hypothetical protein
VVALAGEAGPGGIHDLLAAGFQVTKCEKPRRRREKYIRIIRVQEGFPQRTNFSEIPCILSPLKATWYQFLLAGYKKTVRGKPLVFPMLRLGLVYRM